MQGKIEMEVETVHILAIVLTLDQIFARTRAFRAKVQKKS